MANFIDKMAFLCYNRMSGSTLDIANFVPGHFRLGEEFAGRCIVAHKKSKFLSALGTFMEVGNALIHAITNELPDEMDPDDYIRLLITDEQKRTAIAKIVTGKVPGEVSVLPDFFKPLLSPFKVNVAYDGTWRKFMPPHKLQETGRRSPHIGTTATRECLLVEGRFLEPSGMTPTKRLHFMKEVTRKLCRDGGWRDASPDELCSVASLVHGVRDWWTIKSREQVFIDLSTGGARCLDATVGNKNVGGYQHHHNLMEKSWGFRIDPVEDARLYPDDLILFVRE